MYTSVPTWPCRVTPETFTSTVSEGNNLFTSIVSQFDSLLHISREPLPSSTPTTATIPASTQPKIDRYPSIQHEDDHHHCRPERLGHCGRRRTIPSSPYLRLRPCERRVHLPQGRGTTALQVRPGQGRVRVPTDSRGRLIYSCQQRFDPGWRRCREVRSRGTPQVHPRAPGLCVRERRVEADPPLRYRPAVRQEGRQPLLPHSWSWL